MTSAGGATPDPAGELTAPPDSLAGFNGPISKGRGRRGRKGGKGGEGERKRDMPNFVSRFGGIEAPDTTADGLLHCSLSLLLVMSFDP